VVSPMQWPPLPPLVGACRMKSMKNLNDPTENRTCVCSAVPQLTVPPYTPVPSLMFISFWPHSSCGTTVAQWLRCCTTNWKVVGSIPAGVSGYFIDIKSFGSHYGSEVDSASNRNEYQECFMGLEAAGA